MLGDPTPGRHGRLTFNPLAQLMDTPFYSMILPTLAYLTQGTLFCYAFCPIDPTRFRRPLRDRALVAIAGPVTNFLMMGLFIGILWIPGTTSHDPNKLTFHQLILPHAAYWNLVLGVFNLLPLPGLDGYDVIRGLLPLGIRRPLDDFRRMGFLPLIVALLLGPHLLGFLMEPLLHFFVMLLPGG
jgi:Zn-dependent protease